MNKPYINCSGLLPRLEPCRGRSTADNACEQEKVEFTPDMLYSMARELNAALAEEPEPATKEDRKERKARQKQVKELEEKAKKLTEYDRHFYVANQIIGLSFSIV